MKDKYKILIRTIALSVLVVLMVSVLNAFFQPSWLPANNYYNTRNFYKEPKNTIEALFLGSSVGSYGFSPLELYRDYGICSYNLSSQEQPLFASYYWIEEAYRLHPETLKTVILDVSELRKSANDSSLHKALDGMKLSDVKIRAAVDYADGNYMKGFAYILPLMIYHDRWQELEASDFAKEDISALDGMRGYEFELMTYISTLKPGEEPVIPATLPNENAQPEAFSAEPLEYFYKISDFCKEKNIKLTLVKTPTDNWSTAYSKAVKLLADECGADFLDFNFSPLVDEIGYIHPYDSRESKHLNFFGAKKLMKYLGAYLSESCGLTDVRSNEAYAFMAEQLEKFDRRYNKRFELSQCVYSDDAIKTALTGNNTVFITVKDEASTKLTDEQRAYFDSVGLEKLAELGFRDSYIGIISPGNVIYEAKNSANSELRYDYSLSDNTAVSLISGRAEGKLTAHCIIDGNQTAINGRGLNIVVYDNDIGEVIYSASFDTYAHEKKECYLIDFCEIVKNPEKAAEFEGNTIYNNILSYYERLKENNSIAEEQYIVDNNDIFSFIERYGSDENYMIFLSVKDDCTNSFTDKDRSLASEYGLEGLSVLQFRDSYAAVIEKGSVILEKHTSGTESAVIEGDNYRVESAGFEAGSISSVRIDGREYSVNVRGINAVVYNKASGEIVRAVAFDTYTKEIKTSVE